MRTRVRRAARCLVAMCLVSGVLGAAAARAQNGSVAGDVTLDLAGMTLANVRPVVVYLVPVAAAPASPAPREVPKIHQKNATFSPGFMAVGVGQTVEMPNDDAIYHNVFSYSRPNDFDLGLYAAGKGRSVTFAHPGVVNIYCSIHENMNGKLFVAPSPHFKTVDASGSFGIRDVPPGRYRLETWCEKLPNTSREIVIAPGQRLSVSLPLAQ